MSVNVMVLGPNGINDATFHVHEATCRDVHQARYARVDGSPRDRYRTWVFEVSSRQELTEELFGDFIAENDCSWEEYEGDAKVFPCVKGLE